MKNLWLSLLRLLIIKFGKFFHINMLCDCLNPKNNTLYTIYMIKTQVIFNKIILKVYSQDHATHGNNASMA